MKQNLPKLRGITIVFYPVMPRNTHNKSCAVLLPGDHVAADGAEEEKMAPSDDGSDVDVDTHDFGDDGQLLPETLPQIAAVSSSNE